MRKVMFGALAVLSTVALLGCGGDGTGTGPGNGNGIGNGNGNGNGNGAGGGSVDMRDDFFSPQVDTVEVGSSVLWDNRGNNQHTSTSDDFETWDSGTVNPSETHTATFNEVGEFPYHCVFHGSPGSGMHGTIVVIEE